MYVTRILCWRKIHRRAYGHKYFHTANKFKVFSTLSQNLPPKLNLGKYSTSLHNFQHNGYLPESNLVSNFRYRALRMFKLLKQCTNIDCSIRVDSSIMYRSFTSTHFPIFPLCYSYLSCNLIKADCHIYYTQSSTAQKKVWITVWLVMNNELHWKKFWRRGEGLRVLPPPLPPCP